MLDSTNGHLIVCGYQQRIRGFVNTIGFFLVCILHSSLFKSQQIGDTLDYIRYVVIHNKTVNFLTIDLMFGGEIVCKCVIVYAHTQSRGRLYVRVCASIERATAA